MGNMGSMSHHYPLRVPEETWEKVLERADLADLSINAWINKAIDYALAKGSTEIKYVTTTTQHITF